MSTPRRDTDPTASTGASYRVFIPGVRSGILEGREEFDAVLRSGDSEKKIKLYSRGLTPEERKILADGCLINYYAEKLKEG